MKVLFDRKSKSEKLAFCFAKQLIYIVVYVIISITKEHIMQYLKKDIKDRIIAAAIEEFKLNGYSNASIRNIANNAEISLGNIYRYFTNKEALYFAVINPFMESFREAIQNKLNFHDKNPSELAQHLASTLIQYADEFLIIRQGNTSHYTTFINYLVEIISAKISEYLQAVDTSAGTKVTNPSLCEAVAEGFLVSLFKTFQFEVELDILERYIRELVTFYFGNMQSRFANFTE